MRTVERHSYAEIAHWRSYQRFLPASMQLNKGREPDEEWWPWRGAEIHLDRYTAPAAPLTVVMLHGAGGCGRLLAPFGLMLHGHGFDVVLPDLPGYGLSRVTTELFTYRPYTDHPKNKFGRGKIMKTIAVMSFSLLVVAEAANAEYWPTLHQYVGSCTLIVLCETEFRNNEPVFKVVESWKGEFDLNHFDKTLQGRAPGANYLPAGLRLHSGRKSHPKQKAVFFFTGDPKKRPYDGSSTSFDVREGRLIYGETGNPGIPKEYTLQQFKTAIEKIVAAQAATPAATTTGTATEQLREPEPPAGSN